jgi:ketosteroid isomerase-like protein
MPMTTEESAVRDLLQEWAAATRQGRLDDVLARHRPDALIYDVLAPMKYDGAAAYRASWGDWHPETQSEGLFDWEDLQVTADADLAFAHGFIRCGGTTPDGESFADLVRATFCLQRTEGGWNVAHQHISKPIKMGGGG